MADAECKMADSNFPAFPAAKPASFPAEVLPVACDNERSEGADQMDLCNTSVSDTHSLSERIAREVFDVLPERGPILVIMDRDGEHWTSHPEEFAGLRIDESLLRDLRSKVDDGAEPVITQVGETSVTIAQLATDQTNCGYVVVILPRCAPESALTHIDLVEALLSQVALIARLVEKTATLTRGQMNHYSGLAFSVN
jgi:hypothetical protein